MNILITSVGRRSYLVDWFKEALHGDGLIHVMNSNELAAGFLNADCAVKSPLVYDNNYIPFLLEYCAENKIDAVISLLDVDLPILAANKDAFSRIGTRLIVSDKGVMEICNDKWKTYQFLQDNCFYTPKTWIDINTLPDEYSICPLVVKPRWGSGSLSIFEADNRTEAEFLYRKAEKIIVQSSMLKYEAAQDRDRCVILQEKVNGEEYGLDVINDLDGNYQNTIVKKKLAMRAGETDSAQVVNIPILKELGEKLSNLLKHVANLDVDVIISEGKPYVLEMNARFGGGYPFSHLSGVNLPEAIVKWIRRESDCKELLREQEGVLGYKDILVKSADTRKLKENEAIIQKETTALTKETVDKLTGGVLTLRINRRHAAIPQRRCAA